VNLIGFRRDNTGDDAPPLRFPPPWSVEELEACFVEDSASQKLAYVYFEEKPGRRSAAKLLTKDEAGGLRRISRSCRSWCEKLEYLAAVAWSLLLVTLENKQ
jgi:hypothetical protein